VAECGIVTLRHNVVTTLSQPYKFTWPQRGFSTLVPRCKATLWPRVFVW